MNYHDLGSTYDKDDIIRIIRNVCCSAMFEKSEVEYYINQSYNVASHPNKHRRAAIYVEDKPESRLGLFTYLVLFGKGGAT